MKKIHYSWIVCTGCAILMYCTSGLPVNGFAIYLPYIRDLNGFTNTQSSNLILFRNLCAFIGMMAVTPFYKRFSMRTGMTLAGFMVVLGFVTYGFAGSYISYCIAACIVGLGFGLSTMVPVTILLGKWFTEKRTTALGVCSAVTGISTLGTQSVIASAVEHYGLRPVLLVEAAIIAALVFLAYLLIRNSPEEMGMSPYGAFSDAPTGGNFGPGIDRRDWLILVPCVILIGGVLCVPFVHLSVLMTGEGFSEHTAALAITVSGLCLIVGKIIYGKLGDRIGAYRCNYIFGPMFVAGLVMCCFIRLGIGMLFTTVIVLSFGIAASAVGISVWAGALSDEEHYGRSVQIFQMLNTAGSFLFSSVPGIIADRCGGSYVPFYAGAAVVAFLSYAALQLVFRRKLALKSHT